jgi:hypothetical protein
MNPGRLLRATSGRCSAAAFGNVTSVGGVGAAGEALLKKIGLENQFGSSVSASGVNASKVDEMLFLAMTTSLS